MNPIVVMGFFAAIYNRMNGIDARLEKPPVGDDTQAPAPAASVQVVPLMPPPSPQFRKRVATEGKITDFLN